MATDQAPLVQNAASPHARWQGCSLTGVYWADDSFWGRRFRQCAEVTLPWHYERMDDAETGHVLENFRIAAGLSSGDFAGTHWQDEWLYKWLEAATLIWRQTSDLGLKQQMDNAVSLIAQAQEADGYLATQVMARRGERFQDTHHHELYTMGHLMTAACLHHRLTGEDKLLEVAWRAGEYVAGIYESKPESLVHFPFNPSMIMGAVELYRETGERRFLQVAEAIVNSRGAAPDDGKGRGDMNQDRVPVREEKEAVGHAVLLAYLFAGVADVFLETGEVALLEASERVWEDLVYRKMFITGGTGALDTGHSVRAGRFWDADYVHEAVGPAYFLHGGMAYNETCGQVGLFMWSWRLLLATGKSRYGDVMERELYNGILPGMGLDGKSWFYSNPLRCEGADHPRRCHDVTRRFLPGRDLICCPSNMLRTIAQLHGYFFGWDGAETLLIHQYGACLYDEGGLRLRMETDYPLGGTVCLHVEAAPSEGLQVGFRVPAWCRDGVAVGPHGRKVSLAPREDYCIWPERLQAGEILQLDFPMPARLVMSDPRVEEARGQVAVMRGPVLYCVEGVDLPAGVQVADVRLVRGTSLREHRESWPQGELIVLEADAVSVPFAGGGLYADLSQPNIRFSLRMIPYFAWANREMCAMTVWLPLY